VIWLIAVVSMWSPVVEFIPASAVSPAVGTIFTVALPPIRTCLLREGTSQAELVLAATAPVVSMLICAAWSLISQAEQPTDASRVNDPAETITWGIIEHAWAQLQDLSHQDLSQHSESVHSWSRCQHQL
jgi:hypothetical protein